MSKLTNICQNIKNGADLNNKLGYECSWKFASKNEDLEGCTLGVTDLESVEEAKKIKSIKVGGVTIPPSILSLDFKKNVKKDQNQSQCL